MNGTLNSTNPRTDPGRQVILARVAGFCFGVQRAVEIAEAARRSLRGDVSMYGPIVHNDSVVQRLRDQGIRAAERIDDLPGGSVIISAHGISSNIRSNLTKHGLNVIDATCPFVTKVHRMARLLHEQGYRVIILGERNHREVEGIVGSLRDMGGAADVVSGPEEARKANLIGKIGVVSQTTQRNADYASTVAAICETASEVRAINTICGATDELQEAAVELARRVEVVLVIGGKQSANSARLRALCEEQGVQAYQIETRDDIDEGWLDGKNLIGLTAGASTPDCLIEDVARHLSGGELPEDWELRHPDECN